jgi:hypothetical protein
LVGSPPPPLPVPSQGRCPFGPAGVCRPPDPRFGPERASSSNAGRAVHSDLVLRAAARRQEAPPVRGASPGVPKAPVPALGKGWASGPSVFKLSDPRPRGERRPRADPRVPVGSG